MTNIEEFNQSLENNFNKKLIDFEKTLNPKIIDFAKDLKIINVNNNSIETNKGLLRPQYIRKSLVLCVYKDNKFQELHRVLNVRWCELNIIVRLMLKCGFRKVFS